MSKFLGFFRKTFLWLLLLPYAGIYLGAASNQLVLWANNDTFPVKVNAVKMAKMVDATSSLPDGTVMLDDIHCLMTSKTHLNILADNWDFHDGIESIGDLLIEWGYWLTGFCPFIWIFVMIRKAQECPTTR